mmetsp:Transcript_101141/g.286627  ORF Transcript_101141/g.286627 Transcript_101141/m.286627 type:complete len:265 (+) Transcript_101141:1274-2068(+)
MCSTESPTMMELNRIIAAHMPSKSWFSTIRWMRVCSLTLSRRDLLFPLSLSLFSAGLLYWSMAIEILRASSRPRCESRERGRLLPPPPRPRESHSPCSSAAQEPVAKSPTEPRGLSACHLSGSGTGSVGCGDGFLGPSTTIASVPGVSDAWLHLLEMRECFGLDGDARPSMAKASWLLLSSRSTDCSHFILSRCMDISACCISWYSDLSSLSSPARPAPAPGAPSSPTVASPQPLKVTAGPGGALGGSSVGIASPQSRGGEGGP